MMLNRVLALLLVAVFSCGVFTYATNMIEAHHTMSDGVSHHVCPTLGTTPACISVLEHLAHWQNTLIGIFDESLLLVTFLSVVALCVSFFQCFRLVSPLLRWHLTPGHSLLMRHTLQEAFANGVLHSKAF